MQPAARVEIILFHHLVATDYYIPEAPAALHGSCYVYVEVPNKGMVRLLQFE